jgi:hypothetical protein
MRRRVDYPATLRHPLMSLVFVMVSALPAAAHGAAAAMVTDLQGKATVTDTGKSRDAGILTELNAGAQVQLNAGATLVALYLDAGDEYVFKGPALIVFKPAQPEVINGAKPEKRSPSLGKGGKDIRIKPVGIAQGAIVMRSFRAGARIRLLSLSGTRVLETQPEFRWQELQPGLKYQFEITDDTGRSLHEAQVDAASFKLPAGVQLKEGSSYTWEVSARLPDGRKYSSAGDFSVAPADLRAQATALRPATSAPLSTRVAYAAWLDQVELKDETRKYWRALSAERPEDARLRALAAE